MIGSILKSFGFLTLGKISGDLCMFLLFVVLSRSFGQEGVGEYSFAMALTGLIAAFADFGLYHLSIKEMSRLSGPLGAYFSRVLSLRFVLSALVFVLFLCVLPFLPFSREARLIILIICIYQVFYKLLDGFLAVFIVREESHLAGLLEFSLRAVTALVGILVIFAGGSLVMTLSILPALTCGQLIVAYRIVTKKCGHLQLMASSWPLLMQTLREAVPYGLSGILFRINARVDILFLGFYLGAAAVGIYDPAYRIVLFFMFIPHFAGVAVLPMASMLYVKSRKELESLYHQSLNSIILVGLPISSGIWLIAHDLIILIFGETFIESAFLLQFLTWLVFITCVKSIVGTILLSCDGQAKKARSEWQAALVNILGNTILIPAFGIKGAAIATLTSEIFTVILFAVHIRAVLGWPHVISRMAMSGVATMAFCLLFTYFHSLPLGIIIPISVLIYVGTLVLFKEIRRNEGRTLVNFLKGQPWRLASAG